MAMLVLAACHCCVPCRLRLRFASRSAQFSRSAQYPFVAGWPPTALPSPTSDPLCPPGTLSWNFLKLLSVALHCLKVPPDIREMKEMENINSTNQHDQCQNYQRQGTHTFSSACQVQTRQLQRALQSMESNWPKKATRYSETYLEVI